MMTNWFVLLLFGFWLGMRHATDPDHVVAITTIVARNKKMGASWLLGALWGLGHTITIFFVGVLILIFKVEIPARVGLGMEFCVGLMLILLGFLNMAGFGFGSIGIPKHSHPHDPEDPEHHHVLSHVHEESHSHEHFHEIELPWLKRLAEDAGVFQLLRALCVGLVHGLAGSAAVTLLVLTLVPSPRVGVLYLLIFGAGTLAGMLILSACMEFAMIHLMRSWNKTEKWLTFATGLFSVLFGLYILYWNPC